MRRLIPATAALLLSVGLASHAVADSFFPDRLSATPPTVVNPDVVLFAPDDQSIGLGSGRFIYSLRTLVMIDGDGPDMTIYEADFGAVEFGLVDVLVSMDGLSYVSISGTMSTGVRITGDASHGSANHRKSFDLAGSGLSEVRYIKLQGLADGAPSGTNGFDLDAIGIINGRVPAPGTLLALSGLAALRRRRR